jgi:hypothetical protein
MTCHRIGSKRPTLGDVLPTELGKTETMLVGFGSRSSLAENPVSREEIKLYRVKITALVDSAMELRSHDFH